MAWEWSHTNEAYEYAREQVYNLPVTTLRIIYAEWAANRDGNWNQELYNKALAFAEGMNLRSDVLADFIWEKAEEQRLCDNGGFNAWVCPYSCHQVSFGPGLERIESILTRKE